MGEFLHTVHGITCAELGYCVGCYTQQVSEVGASVALVQVCQCCRKLFVIMTDLINSVAWVGW